MSFTNLKYEFSAEFSFLKECSICGARGIELYLCTKCDELYCDKCGAIFTQFNQIDYDCCESCGSSIDNHEFD